MTQHIAPMGNNRIGMDWTTLATARIDRAAWGRMRPVSLPPDRRFITKHIRAYLRYTAKTALVVELLKSLKG